MKIDKGKYRMKFLKESYGESEQLDDFVYLALNRYRTYYLVELILNKQSTIKYFALKEGAKEYFDKVSKLMKEDQEYYDNATLTLEEVKVKLERDELDSVWIDYQEE